VALLGVTPADALVRFLCDFGRIVTVLFCLPENRRGLLDQGIGSAFSQRGKVGRRDERLDQGRRVMRRRFSSAAREEN
jgi:hypothetical protein